MMAKIDLNGDGGISVEEFVELNMRLTQVIFLAQEDTMSVRSFVRPSGSSLSRALNLYLSKMTWNSLKCMKFSTQLRQI